MPLGNVSVPRSCTNYGPPLTSVFRIIQYRTFHDIANKQLHNFRVRLSLGTSSFKIAFVAEKKIEEPMSQWY